MTGEGQQNKDSVGNLQVRVFRDKNSMNFERKEKKEKIYWKKEVLNFNPSFFDSKILDKSVKFCDFKLLSPLAPSRVAPHLAPLPPLSLCPTDCPITGSHSLCLPPAALPLTPAITLPGRTQFLPLVLEIMGTEHLVATGEGQILPLTWTVCQPAWGMGPHLWQFPGCSKKRLLLILEFPYFRTLCRASELSPVPSPYNSNSRLYRGGI